MSYTHALGRVAELFQKVQQLERENAALRSLVREAMTDHVDFYDLDKAEDYIARAKAALGKEGQL